MKRMGLFVTSSVRVVTSSVERDGSQASSENLEHATAERAGL